MAHKLTQQFKDERLATINARIDYELYGEDIEVVNAEYVEFLEKEYETLKNMTLDEVERAYETTPLWLDYMGVPYTDMPYGENDY